MAPLPGWHLQLLGTARCIHADGREFRPDRKTAVLLAFLALEGRQTRTDCATLLWPDTPGSAARNNLVHLLRRLRVIGAPDLILSVDASLSLAPDASIDVDSNGYGGDLVQATLLPEFEYDDLPNVEEWILMQRELLRARSMTGTRQVIDRLEDAGQYRDALAAAEEGLRNDPLSEELHRAVMRLHYALNDRPAALRSYHRCREVLLRDLSASPSAETVALARAIDLGSLPAAPDTAVPLYTMRPPRLVGREAEWATLEEAWAAQLGVVITGPVGSGKSRLVTDFVRSGGSQQLVLCEGRAGDAENEPLSAHLRMVRPLLETPVTLPAWVRAELLRPRVHDKARFLEAEVELMERLLDLGPAVLFLDALERMDEASLEACVYLHAHLSGSASRRHPVRLVFAYRAEALSERATALMRPVLTSGRALLLELGSLTEEVTSELLNDLHLPALATLSQTLHHMTHGFPGPLLELVRAMRGNQKSSPDSMDDVLSGLFTAMIARRLEGLSSGALQVVRAAAVLDGSASPELVASVLNIGLIDSARAWEELERAQVMSGEWFSHVRLRELVLGNTPGTTLRLLHRAVARALTQSGAAPLLVARHWQAADVASETAAWLARAGDAARQDQPEEAGRLYLEAAQQYERAEQTMQAARLRLLAQTLTEVED